MLPGDFKSAISKANKSDRLGLEIVRDESGNHSIRVLIDDVEEDVIESVHVSEPKSRHEQMELAQTVCISRGGLVSAVELFDQCFEIKGDSSSFTLSKNGVMAEFDFEESDAELVEDSGTPHSSLFKTDYFKPLSKLKHTVDAVSVSFDTDYPCTLEAGHSGVEASVLIAPRIEEE